MKLPTASELPRVAACPASAALPQHRLPESSDASLGTAVHLLLSQGVVPDSDEAQAIGEHLQRALPPGAWRWEVTFALDANGEGRELGAHLSRDYSAANASETVGTADAVAIQGGIARILEVKTGWRPVSADGWQTRWLALAAARAHHCDSAEVTVLTGHPDGARAEVMAYDAFALDAIEQELHSLLARILTDKQPQPGDWCRYCPALSECRAATGLVRALAQPENEIELTPESVAGTYRTLQAARAALTRLEGQLETYALQQPVPLGSGRFWGLRTSTKQVFAPGAAAWLRANGLPAAVSESVSMTSLKRIAGKAANDYLFAMTEAGLVTTKETGRVMEYTERAEP